MSRLWRLLPVPAEHLIGMVVGWGLQRWRPVRLPRRLSPLGWVLALAGVGTCGWAVAERGGGDIDRPERLATTGLHGVTRNPMYAGWTLLHLGAGLATRAAWVLTTWPVSVGLLHRVVVREEAELVALFGEEYEEYRRNVPRYLGDPGGLRLGG